VITIPQLNVTDGQTDGRTTCRSNNALRVCVSRGNNEQVTGWAKLSDTALHFCL